MMQSSSGTAPEAPLNCIVRGCLYSQNRKSQLLGAALHSFPSNLNRIKQWLAQTGQDYGNLDAFARRVLDLKKCDTFRLCSAHFAPECYFIQGTKRVLRPDAVPTIFPVKISSAGVPEGSSPGAEQEGSQGEAEPRCIVAGCLHGTGCKTVPPGVALHGFPNNMLRIKQWLQKTGQDFGDLDAFTQRILSGKKNDNFRICSSHFAPECYIVQGNKRILRIDAVPTIFTVEEEPVDCKPSISQTGPPPLPQARQPSLPQAGPPPLPQARQPSLPQAGPPPLPQARQPSLPQAGPPFLPLPHSPSLLQAGPPSLPQPIAPHAGVSTVTPSKPKVKQKKSPAVCYVDASTSTPVITTRDISTRTDIYHKVRHFGTRTDPHYGVRNVGTRIDPYFRVRHASTLTKPIPTKDASTSTFFLMLDSSTSTEPSAFTAEKGVQWPEFELNFDGEPWKIQHDHLYQASSLTAGRPHNLQSKRSDHQADAAPQEEPQLWNWINSHQTHQEKAFHPSRFLEPGIHTLKNYAIFLALEKVLVSLMQHLSRTVRSTEDKLKTKMILNQALEIVFLLTGEELHVVRKRKHPSAVHAQPDKVPVQYGDVALYFSSEEWEYIEKYKEQYKDVIMEEPATENTWDMPDIWTSEATNDLTEESQVTSCSSDWEEDDQRNASAWHPHGGDPSDESVSEKGNGSSLKRRTRKRREVKEEVVSHDEETPRPSRTRPKRREKRSEQLHWCDVCEVGFPDKLQLVLHETAHIGETPLACTQCHRNFNSKRQLVKHHKTKHGQGAPHTRGKAFGTERRLLEHQESQHGEDVSRDSSAREGRPPEEAPLAQQLEEERGKKANLRCDECGRCFDYRSQLIAHQRTHMGERPYKCDECGVRFGHKCSLVAHQKRHTGEDAAHTCPKCGKQFESEKRFSKHLQRHEQDGPRAGTGAAYKCKQCGKQFVSKKRFNKHRKCHEQDKPHACAHCSKSFIYKSSFLKHQKSHAK